MVDLRTTYMGLELRNPIIVGSSELTGTLAGIERAEEAGAGAVVLKSFFEEQFASEVSSEERGRFAYPEAMDYLERGGLLEYATQNKVRLVEEAKKKVSIPVIASINCRTPRLWPRFARHFEDAGADGLELNVYFLPYRLDIPGTEYENSHLQILEEVKDSVSIPVSMKLCSSLTAVPYLSKRLVDRGCQGLVYFNWFLQPEIDLDRLKTRNVIGQGDFHQTLRWVALCAGRVGCDVVASGGIQRSEDVVKLLLAGATAVQVVSLLFRQGWKALPALVEGLSSWMEEHGFRSVEEFRGELSWKKLQLDVPDSRQVEAYFRTQYIRVFSKQE